MGSSSAKLSGSVLCQPGFCSARLETRTSPSTNCQPQLETSRVCHALEQHSETNDKFRYTTHTHLGSLLIIGRLLLRVDQYWCAPNPTASGRATPFLLPLPPFFSTRRIVIDPQPTSEEGPTDRLGGPGACRKRRLSDVASLVPHQTAVARHCDTSTTPGAASGQRHLHAAIGIFHGRGQAETVYY